MEAAPLPLRADPDAALTEDTYLDMLADIDWTPTIRYLQSAEAELNRFAFVIHPLNVSFIHNDKRFRWTRFCPTASSNRLPPRCRRYLSRITGGQSPTTDSALKASLITLAATPRQMMKRDARFTYKKLNQAARLLRRVGAYHGTGAFTSVVGDAGITVAHESDIAITSGNSLTVAATLESAKQAVINMGATDLTGAKWMIVGDRINRFHMCTLAGAGDL